MHFELIFVEGVRSLPQYFTCGFPIIPELLVEEAIFDLLYCLFSSVKDHLTIFMRVYFWIIMSIDLFFLYSECLIFQPQFPFHGLRH